MRRALGRYAAMQGRGVVFSGSCSRATRGQIASYLRDHPDREVSASEVIARDGDVGDLAEWLAAQQQAPLIYTAADPAVVRDVQAEYGTEHIATAIEAIFADLAAWLAQEGITRMVIAGGETSGAVMVGLRATHLTVGPRLAARFGSEWPSAGYRPEVWKFRRK